VSDRGRIVLAGGSGLIGRRLATRLAGDGHDVVVLTRSPRRERFSTEGVRAVEWNGREVGAWAAVVDGARAVVNLCGENVGSGRWTAARKRRLRSSRLEPTRALVEAVGRASRRPDVFLQSSAVGIYGSRGAEALDEEAEPGRGFLSDLSRAWESSSSEIELLGPRRVLLRTAVVLAHGSGALAKMLPAFRLGVAGRLGDGTQFFPWIHLEDAVTAIEFLLAADGVAGPVNLSAPEAVTNLEFTKALGRALRRPTVIPVPATLLRLLFGEMAQVLLASQRVVPRRLAEAGFAFRHPTLDGALDDLVGRQ